VSKTSIEWTTDSWNPIRARRKDTGKIGWHCERVSDGCKNCYAATFNQRMLPNGGTGLDYTRQKRDEVEIYLDEEVLLQPLGWKKPRKVFVCSMTDLFGEFVPFELVDHVMAVMALCPEHTFQVLTKRPERSVEHLKKRVADGWDTPTGNFHDTVEANMTDGFFKAYNGVFNKGGDEYHSNGTYLGTSPGYVEHEMPNILPNVQIGTSAEDQPTINERAVHLRELSNAGWFTWFSLEPLIDQIHLPDQCYHDPDVAASCWIDWIVVGGESGRPRPCNIDWIRSIVQQCRAAGVPVFVKQLGTISRRVSGGVTRDVRMKKKGGQLKDFPADLRVREFPKAVRI